MERAVACAEVLCVSEGFDIRMSQYVVVMTSSSYLQSANEKALEVKGVGERSREGGMNCGRSSYVRGHGGGYEC